MELINQQLEGKLLIATTSLDDSVFERGLIFICSHGPEGSVGVMINKKIGEISSSEFMEGDNLKRFFSLRKKFQLFCGGPVEEQAMLILSASKKQKVPFSKNQPLKLFTNAEGFLKDVIAGKNKDKFLILKGFCGWSAGQLEEEINENSWMLCVPDLKTIFSAKPEKQWESSVKKMGIKNIQKFKDLVSYTGNA